MDPRDCLFNNGIWCKCPEYFNQRIILTPGFTSMVNNLLSFSIAKVYFWDFKHIIIEGHTTSKFQVGFTHTIFKGLMCSEPSMLHGDVSKSPYLQLPRHSAPPPQMLGRYWASHSPRSLIDPSKKGKGDITHNNKISQ